MKGGIVLKVVVSGRVQGVGYRNFVLRIANELGIKGYVRNQSDGTVLLQAAGSNAQLDQLLEWCQNGPPMAKVSKIDVTPIEQNHFNEFKIIR